MSDVVNAVGQVPFVPVLIVLFMLFLVVFVVSRDRRRDCFRLVKGVFVTAVISFVVFSNSCIYIFSNPIIFLLFFFICGKPKLNITSALNGKNREIAWRFSVSDPIFR